MDEVTEPKKLGRPRKNPETVDEPIETAFSEEPDSGIESKRVKAAEKVYNESFTVLTADQKKIPDFKKKVVERYLLLTARLERQIGNEKAEPIYPEITINQFRAELHAIKKGIWYPGWKLPAKPSPLEAFLSS